MIVTPRLDVLSFPEYIEVSLHAKDFIEKRIFYETFTCHQVLHILFKTNKLMFLRQFNLNPVTVKS